PFGLSSSMVTIVAGGPDRDNLHSVREKKIKKIFITRMKKMNRPITEPRQPDRHQRLF
ncbi:protocadherin-related 15a precursor, partial [Triplophysa rosa]